MFGLDKIRPFYHEFIFEIEQSLEQIVLFQKMLNLIQLLHEIR